LVSIRFSETSKVVSFFLLLPFFHQMCDNERLLTNRPDGRKTIMADKIQQISSITEQTKPQADRVFYANSINWLVTQQEAIFDFRLVLPEDYKIQAEATPVGTIEGTADVDLSSIPVAVRVIIPRFQFDILQKKIPNVAPLDHPEVEKDPAKNE
jgi:hypothetical protein